MKKTFKAMACILLILLIAMILKMTVFSTMETFVEHNTEKKTRTIKMEFEKEDEKNWPEGCELSDNGNTIRCNYDDDGTEIKILNKYNQYPEDYLKDKENLATHNGMLYNKKYFDPKKDTPAYKNILEDGLIKTIGGTNSSNISKKCVLLNSEYNSDDKYYTIEAMCKEDANSNGNIPLKKSTITNINLADDINICNGVLQKDACT